MIQALRNSLSLFFSSGSFQAKEDIKTLPTNDVAWSEASAIYALGDFEKYNPDDLIGRKGYRVYRKMMIDEQVKAVVKFKRDAITAKDWYFEIDNPDDLLSPEEVDARLSLSYKIVDKMQGSWMDALNGIMSAIYNGFSMTEKIHTQIEHNGLTWWGLDKLKLKPYDTFYFNVDEFGNILSITQKLSGQEQFVDPRKFIHYVVNPDMDDQYGQSELREAYRAYFSKDVVIKFRNMWLEKHAGGFRYVQAKEGKTINPGSQEYVKLQTLLNNIQTSTGLILPSTVDIKGEYPANNVAYKEAVNECDTAIARALLVPNLLGVSPQGNVGSYSQSTNQLEAFLWTLESDGKRLEEALNEQLFRELGEQNYSDGLWPKFKFKPATGSKKLEIIKTWKELVAGKAVIATDTDEAHLRELLEFPEPGEEINKQPEIQPQLQQPQQENEQGDDNGAESNIDDDNNDSDMPDNSDDRRQDKRADKEKEKPDQTIAGHSLVSVSAFKRAMRRVDFKVIDKGGDALAQEYTKKTAFVIDLIVNDLFDKFKEEGNLDEIVRTNIQALKIDSKLKTKLNATVKAGLKEGSNLGEKHAKFEIDKAKADVFSRQMNTQRLDMLAKDYLAQTAFKITSDFTGRIISIMKDEILNGAKKESTLKEVENAINERLASKGLMSQSKLEKLKDEKKDFAVEDIETGDFGIGSILNTYIFDSINNARYSFFTDPELDDFVQAFEYSAILDSRTTTICRHLDEGEAGNHSARWYENNPQYRPPNHYNCRSLLIPVTIEDMDEYREGPEPAIQPQSGFG